MTQANIHLRLAVPEDVPALRELIEASVRDYRHTTIRPRRSRAPSAPFLALIASSSPMATYILAEAESGPGDPLAQRTGHLD